MKYCLITLLATSAALFAQVPSLINYQGRLTDANGAPVTGSKNFTLSIYDGETEGSLLYSEDIAAVTLDDNGVYSFQFGESGTSQATATKSVGVADGIKNVFNTVLPEEATGIVSITDGTYTWTPEAGSTAPTSFIGSYDGASKTVSAIYIGGGPSGGVEISAVYKSETDGISAALASGNEHWLELSIDGTTQSSRVRILAVPFAQRSNVANKALEGVDSEARSQLTDYIKSTLDEPFSFIGNGNGTKSNWLMEFPQVIAAGSNVLSLALIPDPNSDQKAESFLFSGKGPYTYSVEYSDGTTVGESRNQGTYNFFTDIIINSFPEKEINVVRIDAQQIGASKYRLGECFIKALNKGFYELELGVGSNGTPWITPLGNLRSAVLVKRSRTRRAQGLRIDSILITFESGEALTVKEGEFFDHTGTITKVGITASVVGELGIRVTDLLMISN
jgi:hypothetical protein